MWIRQVRLQDGRPPQIAYSVSRAVGNAVVRNRIRRRLRAIIAARATTLSEGHGYLVGVTPGASDQTFGELSHSIDVCLAATHG